MKRVFGLVLALVAAPRVHAAEATAPQIVALPPNDHPTVALALQFKSGAVDDPPGKAGLTYLAARVMAEGGTQKLDAKQLLDALFPMAAEIDPRVDKELTTFRTTVHRDHLARMVGILTDVVAHPRWDEREFARLRELAVNDLEKRLRQGDDENLGKEALGELLYAGHPYGRATLGHVGDLRAVTLAEVKAHAARVFTRDRLVIGVAGGYPKELPAELAAALSSLPAHGAATVALAAPTAAKPRFRLVEKPAEATAISLGFPWKLSRRDSDFIAMTVARSAFGEHRQFNGRLMQRLREARGLNYGDYAYLEHFEQEHWDAATAQTGRVRRQQDFTIWLRPVQNENRLFALRAALYELGRTLGPEPFTADEVESTKAFLDGYVRLFAQTDARKLGYAMDDRFLGVDRFLDGWLARLQKLTPAEVNAAWRKWVDPQRLQIVLVGPDAAALKREILAGAASPMHYPNAAQKQPAALLAADSAAEKQPLGARGDGDVEVVPVAKLFE
jgi:zinc protease